MATTTVEIAKSGDAVVGIDTHKYVHVAAVFDTTVGFLSTISVPADSHGFTQLLSWTESFEQPIALGIEGTGSYGGALTSFVRRRGYRVIEVARPDRRIRRLVGKSDTIDAQNAVKAVMAGFATAEPKTADGADEMIHQLKVGHDTAVKARATTMVTLNESCPPSTEGSRVSLSPARMFRSPSIRSEREVNTERSWTAIDLPVAAAPENDCATASFQSYMSCCASVSLDRKWK